MRQNSRPGPAAHIAAWLLGLVLLIAGARDAAAQETPNSGFNLDKLEITSLGVAVGRILPSQVEPTNLYAVQADYGDIAPRIADDRGAGVFQ